MLAGNKRGVVLNERDRKVAVLDEDDIGRVGRRGDEVEEWRGVVGVEVVDVHPTLERTAHRVEHSGRRARRLELRQTVDDLQVDRRIARVCVRDATD